MKKKTNKLIVLGLSAVIGAGSLLCALPSVDVSANTLAGSSTPLDVYGYLDDGTAKFNPFGPYRFHYYSEYSHMVYGVDIPESYGGMPSEWVTEAPYSVFDILDYSNNTGIFGVQIVDFTGTAGIPCINLQLTSDLLWLDSFRNWYILTDTPCNIDLFVWYDGSDGEHTFTRYNQDYAEWEDNDGSYALDVYAMLTGFADEVDSEYGFTGSDGIVPVRTFTITFTPTEDLTQFLTLPLFGEGDDSVTLNSYNAYRYTYFGSKEVQEAIPDDFFGWIFDVVGGFLDTEFLPDVSFGKLMLLALGFVVFGLGLKIAFGG